jgi:4-amino-4-deoxy-L-arabinose transferase-like glycosyltransferase
MLKSGFKEIGDHKLVAVQIALLIMVSLVLRLAALGYSNFQGDEIQALCRFSDTQSPIQFLAYLLAQRKGPVQFLITCAYSLFDPAFSSEAAMRLPFAMANLAGLVCLFLLARRLFNLQTAIYAAFLFAVNGIFIAFGRIVQYQSFVILGGLGALFSLSLALDHEKWRLPGLYLAFSLAAVSLLAHFDAAFFLPPLGVLVLHGWRRFRSEAAFPRLRWHLVGASALFAFLVLAFYVPYALRLGPYQTENWEGRFTSNATNFRQLFQFYNPGPFFWIGLGLVALGLTRVRNNMSWQVILAWLVPPLVFMTLIFRDSRTHAYTYLLPMCIVAALGLETIVGWLKGRWGERAARVTNAALLVLFLALFYISYSIFVDRQPEYPWSPKQVLGMQLQGGDLEGTFGFPYDRDWRAIGHWFEQLPQGGDTVLVTNEKDQIASFYLPPGVRNLTRYSKEQYPGKLRAPDGVYVLIVEGPQSWLNDLWGLPPAAWHEKFPPLQDFVDADGRRVAAVYFLTQEQIEAEFHSR